MKMEEERFPMEENKEKKMKAEEESLPVEENKEKMKAEEESLPVDENKEIMRAEEERISTEDKKDEKQTEEDLLLIEKNKEKSIRKRFSEMGWFLMLYYSVSIAVIIVLTLIFPAAASVSGSLSFWLINLLPMYCIGLPAAWLLICRRWKPQTGFGQSISMGRWLLFIPVTFFFMSVGNIIGLALTFIADGITGTEYSNVVTSLATGSIWYQILFMVIVAPVAEELIFRKILISRLRVYGQKTAIVLSAALFGLYHGNLQQACYAFALGLVFGYVYNKTGDFKTCVGLHMVVNFSSGVLPMYFLNQVSEQTLLEIGEGNVSSLLTLLSGGGEEFLALCGYGVCLLIQGILALLGVVLFCIRRRDLHFEDAPEQLPRGKAFSIAFCNAGVLVFAITMVAIGVYSFGR